MTRAKFTITVPVSRVSLLSVVQAVSTAIIAAGGCTRVDAEGNWIGRDGANLHEPVRELSFLADETNYNPVASAVKDIALALLAAGEQAVLVQHWINTSFGYNLYTKENFNEQSIQGRR